MIWPLNETHDPDLRSWVEAANDAANDFPIQNLPYGVFRRRNSDEPPRIGVAIGDQILDLALCGRNGFLDRLPREVVTACQEASLNALMALGRARWTALRQRVRRGVRTDTGEASGAAARFLIAMNAAEMCLPAGIRN